VGFTTDALAGQRALVTGASRGIGRAIARRLAASGADVAVAYRSREDEAAGVVREIQELGRDAFSVAADLERDEEVDRLFETVARRFGGLSLFISNAAATAFKPLAEVAPHHLDRSYALNWKAFVLGARRAAELMGDRGGAMVAVSGFGSERCLPGYGILGPLKAAVEASVRYLGVEMAPRGIRVNGVNPGFLHTDSSRVYFERSGAASWEHVVRMTPMGRATTPEDVANVVTFLCLPEADFICGQTIVVDGGLTLMGPPYPAAMMEGAGEGVPGVTRHAVP
jgi:enoyl-[acyl-carrier protein] reductase III